MTKKDKHIYRYILKHFDELDETVDLINNNFDLFDENKIYQKAIKMDLLQIGELVNTLSDEVKICINKRDLRGIVEVRNYVAHGYVQLNNMSIWNDIHDDLPRLINQLKTIFE